MPLLVITAELYVYYIDVMGVTNMLYLFKVKMWYKYHGKADQSTWTVKTKVQATLDA